MSNFAIEFSNPWLLFLLIPALFLTLFPYFRLAKKYRRTRNRIVAMVLNMVIMVLCVSLLSGITFTYDKDNLDNEVIVLVDCSYSGNDQKSQRDDFVRAIINDSGENFKVGVVKFGYDQVYAAPLDTDMDRVYDNYVQSGDPDVSATDIASALSYARSLFSSPKSAKIVLLSDGFETDRQAASVVRAIAADGVRVDTAVFPNETESSEVQLIGVVEPESKIKLGEPFDIGVKLQSSGEIEVTVTLYDTFEDERKEVGKSTVTVKSGVQTVGFSAIFEKPGMHCLSFEMSIDGYESDSIEQNNVYNYYYLLNTFNNVLVIERDPGEADEFIKIIKDSYEVTPINVFDVDGMPKSLDALRAYDQVVLFNIANADMPEGFAEILHSYVYDIGGGLLTIGGNKTDASGNTVANTYVEADMNDPELGTAYQRMLPVQAIEYTPPLAVAIVIDISGSMGNGSAGTALYQAKQGAISCLDALEDQDFCGVYTLDDKYSEVIPVTPCSQKADIIYAIENNIKGSGSTVYSGALDRAGLALNGEKRVEKRHIILVSDGQPSSSDDYLSVVKRNYTYGITMSMVLIGNDYNAWSDMKKMVDEAHGNIYPSAAGETLNISDLPRVMREDLNIPIIKNINEEEFIPRIRDSSPAVSGVNQDEIPALTGYYGSRLKNGAKAPLMGAFVPVYAEWDYGSGSVGSFMCDLSGHWSSEWFKNSVGHRLIFNFIDSLFPTTDIGKREIDVAMYDDNYRTQMSIYSSLAYTDKLEVEVSSPVNEDTGHIDVQKFTLTPREGFSRVSFENKIPGLYTVIVKRIDANGKETGTTETYKMFSYSKEYNGFNDVQAGITFMDELAEGGGGSHIDYSWEVYEGFTRSFHEVYDPRVPFLIIAIVLFLLEIAARKFKFKWIHEIIRERRERKAEEGGK